MFVSPRSAFLLSVSLLFACSDGSLRRDAGDVSVDGSSSNEIASEVLSQDVSVPEDASLDAFEDTAVMAEVLVPADQFTMVDVRIDANSNVDASGSTDTNSNADALRDTGVDARADAGGAVHVHISISNTCSTSVDPMEYTAPVMSRTMFSFHNHSRDYNADVWMSYGGGFLDLARGATWNDPIGHCITPTVHDEYADISIAGGGSRSCPAVRFVIHCR